jgi:ubiquinone/menaquinone biosynthesis C-methylase UbiE
VDSHAGSIEQARRRFIGEAGLEFVCAQVEKVPFQLHSFDVAVSIDSSHCLGDMDLFLGEARRILRPGGELLLADLREDWTPDEASMLAHRFEILEVEELSDKVVQALDEDSVRRQRLARTQPAFLRGAAEVVLGLPGTPIYNGLRDGWLQYVRYRLRRPVEDPPLERVSGGP